MTQSNPYEINHFNTLSIAKVNVLLLSKMLEHVAKARDAQGQELWEKRSYHVGQMVEVVNFMITDLDHFTNDESNLILSQFYQTLMHLIARFTATKDLNILGQISAMVVQNRDAWQEHLREDPVVSDANANAPTLEEEPTSHTPTILSV